MTPMKRMYHQEWMPSIFGDFFDTNWMGRAKATAPAINVIEKKDEYKVQVAAPGMTKDDFRIHLDEAGDLVIVIEKCCNCDDKDSKECKEKEKECCDEKECKYLRREFSYAKFEQTLVLPDDVDKSHIKAKVKHGVLHIKLPRKVEEEKPQVSQSIPIE
ncbi:MAG: Hsp20/alpha crystallin family protein [Bacteroidaceae bacterium]|nr:Hsp20/alpha crystallin family protein [Bacteroidaceae bacterium]MBO5135363.1 Hsp20/alpha crystallin family protein [Bacteroidaceae bacterium]MBQ3238071.1 Hsp20/alpha crystallin family protein [Bacteroidaceae bacterium]MBQ7966970.1 Hsp20/alpha crystallin family protein [Bacteroidaceae bacterium]MBR3983424.1 Hsp20/alpha crystallin family protein [Bacteroidaceae bacterium]